MVPTESVITKGIDGMHRQATRTFDAPALIEGMRRLLLPAAAACLPSRRYSCMTQPVLPPLGALPV